MSEKADVDEVENNDSSLPTHQYSREELRKISESPAARRRPAVLEKAYDTEDGKWDPERWVRGKFGFRESSPLTLGDGKDRRDLDRDLKRRPSVNDPVERLKENERDGIVLSPQRRSFGTGCHVQSFSRQLSSSDRDRDRDRERDDGRGDRDRDRGPSRKIGSGRITIDRENSRDFSSLRDRDRFDDRNDRERDFAWNRDRERDRDRDFRDGDWDRDRDRRFDRGERMRRGGDRDFPDRDRRGDRDRDYRGYDRSSRNRHYRHEEKEPEWFTGGPTSQNEIIELRGFEKEGEKEEQEHIQSRKTKPRASPAREKASKADSAIEDAPEADGLQSQCSSPEDDQHQEPTQAQPKEPIQFAPSPVNNGAFFDFDQILRASLPLEEENSEQGSRFSQFFRESTVSSGNGAEVINFDGLIPRDLLDSRPSPSPTTELGSMGPLGGAMSYQFVMQQQMAASHLPGEARRSPQPALPNSAGDNSGTRDNKADLPPSVTALFNTASMGGSNASVSSASSFSAQDASAQLKAMLFGGPKDSNPSSGTASPSLLPASVQKKVKTVAELEADMHHQNSPQASASPSVSTTEQPGDLTAFNKLLIMLNAGSEADHNAIPPDNAIVGQAPHGMMPGHSEFNHALLRNKEQQMALLQQSMHQHSFPPMETKGMHPLAPQGQGPPGASGMGMHPSAMSTPLVAPPANRAPSGSDPILSLIQQHPTIVMKPASPLAGGMPTQQQAAGPKSARVPSPLMFSQQPPLHLSAPSPIHPSQLSPHTLTVAANSIPSNSGVRSPVLPRVPSPQELSANCQAVMFNALIKKQLHDQSERFLKKQQQERATTPSQQQHISVVKAPPAAQPILPPNPQPKGATVNSFTPTSVMRKMHSDKAVEKEKQALGNKQEEDAEYMPSMTELGPAPMLPSNGSHLDSSARPMAGRQPTDSDLSDISFLEPVNPNLVGPVPPEIGPGGVGVGAGGLAGRVGQTNVLPGNLSHPMSVEEKMKLSKLAAEKPGYLSQVLDKTMAVAEASRPGQGRPIVKGPVPSDQLPPEGPLESSALPPGMHPGPMVRPPPPMAGRPVTGTPHNPLQGPSVEMSGLGPPNSAPMSGGGGGRAIVGGSSVQQVAGPEFLRLLEAQRQQHSQGNLVLPPPPLHCMGPPPVALPVGSHMVTAPAHSAAFMHQQQMARASALQSQHLSQLMALQQRGVPPLPTAAPPGPLSPQAGPLSPATLSATLQRVASPHKLNGGGPPASGGVPDMSSGIQRWFSPDILRTQLPSMPPLPSQGSHVMTVDELERN